MQAHKVMYQVMYQANFPRVAHETMDGETIIIDTQTGYYYTASGQASVAWCALVAGHSPQSVAQAYKTVGIENTVALDVFVQQLLAAALITESGSLKPAGGPAVLPLPNNTELLFELKLHADLQELIELDPIHEVDTSQGWPIQKKGNT